MMKNFFKLIVPRYSYLYFFLLGLKLAWDNIVQLGSFKKSFDKFKGDSKVSTWIYRVALNTSMNFNRKRRNDKLFFIGDLMQNNSLSWLIEQTDSSQTDILYQCIDELSELNKALILLYLDGNSHDEISIITGVSKTNVGTRISRIKEQIKNLAITKI